MVTPAYTDYPELDYFVRNNAAHPKVLEEMRRALEEIDNLRDEVTELRNYGRIG